MEKLFANLKKRVALLTILCMMVTLVPSAVSAATVSDISGHWAQTTIQAWVDQGYINGYPDGTFKPENPISREEVASIIMKINKLVANEAGANHFTDANTLVWSKGAVGACYLAGILKGYPDGSFKGKNYIKRGEAVVALDRSSKYIAPVVVVTPPAVDTGGGSGGTVNDPDFALTNLLYNDNAPQVIGDVYQITTAAITTSSNQAIDVTVVGSGFDNSKVYAMTVTVNRTSSPVATTSATIQNIAGGLLNQTQTNTVTSLSALLDYYTN